MRESDPVIKARTLFAAIVKKGGADCILDVGSRDGEESLFFRGLAPKARIAAFEANPANYRAILAKNLDRQGIEVYPYAATDANGVATFYVADAASDPHAWGSSSLLPGGYALKEKIDVETRRLDDFILEHYPDVRRIALWIDVESAECQVLEGLSKIKDRVLVVHTETALVPVRETQKSFSWLADFMKSWGFVFCGSTFKGDQNIGDALFLNAKMKSELGASFQFYFMLARLYGRIPLGEFGTHLRGISPGLYRLLHKIYIRIST